MAKTDIWMPIYIGDYLSDTMHLTTELHGAYFLLLMAYWKKGGALPANDAFLMGVCRMNPDAWSISKAVLMQFFDTSDGSVWFHNRVEKEIEEARARKEKSTDKAKKASSARWAKEKDMLQACYKHSSSNAYAMLEQCPSPSPSQIQKKQSSARGSRLPADWALTDSWKTEAFKIRPDWNESHVQRIADGFRDYWIAKAGAGASKTDWLATWRNWCRNDKTPVFQSQAPSSQNGGGGHSLDPRQQPGWKPKPMPVPVRHNAAKREADQ